MSILNKIKLYFSMRKIDYFFIFMFVLINALIAGGTYYRNGYEYSLNFLRVNVIAIIIILLGCEIMFYLSYRKFIKKNPSIIIILLFTLFLMLITYNVISVNFLLANLWSKAVFNNGTNIFILLNLIFLGSIISNYDFPQSFNIYEFYKNSIDHFYSNIAIFIVIVLLTAVIGYLNTTFIYAISLIILMSSIYFIKAILANIRK